MKKLNTLKEEINRMKSLFGESRLYGNLVSEDTEPSPDKVKEVMEPIKKDTLKILSVWKSYNNNYSELGIRALPKIKGKIKEEIEKAESIISGMDSKDFCSDATLSKIEIKRMELEKVETKFENILTDKDKGFISRLKGKMNLLKDECKRLKTETSTEEVIDSEEETETNTEEVIDSEEETETNTENTNDSGNNNYSHCQGAIEIDETVEGGVLDLVKMIGGTMIGPSVWKKAEGEGCKAPMELSEKTRNSTKEIVFFSDNFYDDYYTGGIDLCGNSLFRNVTKIRCLEIFNGDEIKNMFPNLKTIDLLIVYKKGKFLDMLPDGVLINDFYFGNVGYKIVDDFIKINKQMKKIPDENLSTNYWNYLVNEMGWKEDEFDGDYYIVNPNILKGKSDDSVVIPKTEPTTTPSTPKEPKTTPTTKIEPDLISKVENEDVTWSDEDGTYKVGELEYLGIKNGLNTFKIKTDGRRVIGDPWQNKISEMYEENILSSLERMKNKYGLNYDPYGNIDVISKNKFTIK